MDVSLNEHNHDDFLEHFPLGSFLQSTFWKEFLRRQGKRVWQLNVFDDEDRLIAHSLLYSTKLPLGKSYLYSPKGPIILPTLEEKDRKKAFELILTQIRDITIATAKREEIFCRLEPNIMPLEIPSIEMHTVPGVQPTTTIYNKIDKSPEELIKTFKEKTRYNIRLAERKGIHVHWSTGDDGIKVFTKLLSKSAHRNKIKIHDREYYKLLFEVGREHDTIAINWAEYQGNPIAANLYVILYPTITYIHGGFDYRYRNVMAPYLLQWEAMKYAYEQQIPYYDFWGYTPSDGSKPKWAGFSRFKEGFGGTVVENPGAFDFVYVDKWYKIYTNAKRFLR